MEQKENEVIFNDFILVNESQFVISASIPHIFKVDKFQARMLNIKYRIKIYWCSYKRDGEEFDAYLADLGYGKNEKLIYSKLTEAIDSIFEQIK